MIDPKLMAEDIENQIEEAAQMGEPPSFALERHQADWLVQFLRNPVVTTTTAGVYPGTTCEGMRNIPPECIKQVDTKAHALALSKARVTALSAGEPDGYAVLIDDEASAVDGIWFVGAYVKRETAESVAKRQKARVQPIYFAHSATTRRTIVDEIIRDLDAEGRASVIASWTGEQVTIRKWLDEWARRSPDSRGGG